MSFTFRPAVRENVPLLIGLAGGTGSGKTYSAMELAKGLALGQKFVVLDTENGRARHYADAFDFDVADIVAPFRPDTYAEAIMAADADPANYPVIVVDSMSHEYAGEGVLLDWHEEEFQRMGGRDAVKITAWIKPKTSHKAMVQKLLQVRAHVILCFRAEEKIEIFKKPDGKTEIRPKQTLTGADGWVPITEKNLPYELTASFLLVADKPGVPRPIKLQAQHMPFFPLDSVITEQAGKALGEWAVGGTAKPAAKPKAEPAPEQAVDGWADEADVVALLQLAAKVSGDALEITNKAVNVHRGKYGQVKAEWLGRQLAAIKAKLPAEEEAPLFKIPESVGADS